MCSLIGRSDFAFKPAAPVLERGDLKWKVKSMGFRNGRSVLFFTSATAAMKLRGIKETVFISHDFFSSLLPTSNMYHNSPHFPYNGTINKALSGARRFLRQEDIRT